ncbi:MAG: hypothetical protein MUC74_12335 [Ideonella sp.]|nr:hypothetical protein [Ideonella sp.]
MTYDSASMCSRQEPTSTPGATPADNEMSQPSQRSSLTRSRLDTKCDA